MTVRLIRDEDQKHASQKLEHYYKDKLIAAEKKCYLTDLESSQGPYLGIEGHDGRPSYIMDAASQIATLGLGFNPSVFFGVAQFSESWSNDQRGENFEGLKKAYADFFQRRLKWDQVSLTFCNSGAEANETALGFCFANRRYKQANKVLAFEGSFHGRMMVSLMATWNKSKREPFEWDEYKAVYCPYPDIESNEIHQSLPDGWREFWDQSTIKNFSLPSSWSKDHYLKREVDCLVAVRDQLLKREIFAIIIEPMQCEGGDRYSSDRFHTALLLMARSFGVPVIYDEVQTGFHLGREFFWHKQFIMTDAQGLPLLPQHVVCAKKAQSALVLSQSAYSFNTGLEGLQVASVVRGYLHALALDQSQIRILKLETRVKEKLENLINKYAQFIHRPRGLGLAFAFDLKDGNLLNDFINLRFKHGLLYYPAGSHTLRFRLNTAFAPQDLDYLFCALDKICAELFLREKINALPEVTSKSTQNKDLYEWHKKLLDVRIKHSKGEGISVEKTMNDLKKIFKEDLGFELVRIDQKNYKDFEDRIAKLEQATYEPARQTDISNFEKVAKNPRAVALATLKDNELMGIVFASPLKDHPFERGVRRDPFFHNEDVLYMLDTTVAQQAQGKGLGKRLKYALCLLASAEGRVRVHGRNRDRLAASMLSVNLSLGCYELFYIPEDYMDFQPFRDVLYYTIPLTWKPTTLSLAQGPSKSIHWEDLTQDFLHEQLPYLINKVCLSNFVSEKFLIELKEIVDQLPQELRHAYTTSGQSECVDKLAKTLWVCRDSSKKSYRMLSFNGHFFGKGSFLSRSLGKVGNENYFPVDHLDQPLENNWKDVLSQVEKALQKQEYLAVWIEPLTQLNAYRAPKEFLKALKTICHKYNVNLVFNETASDRFFYSENYYFASEDPELIPDAGMCYLGGQSGIVFTKEKLFLDKPLMMISTWDGDEYSLALYNYQMRQLKKNKAELISQRKAFTEKLTKELEKYQVQDLCFKNACGSFKGEIPHFLSQYFSYQNDHYVIWPSDSAIKSFMKLSPKGV